MPAVKPKTRRGTVADAHFGEPPVHAADGDGGVEIPIDVCGTVPQVRVRSRRVTGSRTARCSQRAGRRTRVDLAGHGD
jgi:hypothetical protein